jgi:hypothetical protein
MLRRTSILATALGLLAILPGIAGASESAKLTAAFTPDRLGTPTTISFDIQIAAHDQIAAPLTGIDIHYPVDLGLATTGLGLATCPPSALRAIGLRGCPADSLMGHGSALAEIPVASDTFTESASITLLAGSPQNGHLSLIVYAQSKSPVETELIFSALLLPGNPPFGGRLHFNVPLVPTFPEASDVAITQIQTTLGPLGLTYYEPIHGKLIPYHPQGIQLPKTCPHHGFPFEANITFQNGTDTTATTTVPCPRSKHNK